MEERRESGKPRDTDDTDAFTDDTDEKQNDDRCDWKYRTMRSRVVIRVICDASVSSVSKAFRVLMKMKKLVAHYFCCIYIRV
jgi:hypothetical protein